MALSKLRKESRPRAASWQCETEPAKWPNHDVLWRFVANSARAGLETFGLVHEHNVIKCPGVFQNTPGVFWNTLRCTILRRAPRGRPGLAGCLPRCVRMDGRVEVCARSVPALAEPRTFVQWVLKEQHSYQTFGQWRRQQSDGQSGLPSTALDHVSATERSPILPPRL